MHISGNVFLRAIYFFFLNNTEAVVLRSSVKEMFLEFSQCHRKAPVPESFAKFRRTPFLQNTSGRPLLIIINSKPAEVKLGEKRAHYWLIHRLKRRQN